MKKQALTLVGLLATVGAYALTVGNSTPVCTDCTGHNPVISADGKTLLISADDHTGLSAINLADGKISVIDTAGGAGFHPVFSTDGTTVYYRTANLIDGLMHRDLRSFNLATNAAEQLDSYTREDIDMDAEAGKANYAIADYKTIKRVCNGIETTVSPLADAHSYLWASLSPDGKHMLFVEPFKGVYIAAADGSSPRRIAAKGDFPAWASNNIVVYTVSHDDGYVILDSTLKATDITTGETTDLTGNDVVVGESTAAPDGTVIYTTVEGNIFKLSVK